MARVGVLGGAFNPPHLGHLLLAQEARVGLGLDHVVLVPTGQPPHKALEADPGAEVRAELCDAAVVGDPCLSVSRLELERGGPSFTVDTLRALRAQRPDDALTLLVGGDQAEVFGTWRAPTEILALAALGVAERADHRRTELLERLGEIDGADGRVAGFAMPRFDVSSSLVRERIRAGLPIRHLVRDAVAERIVARGLYRPGA